MTELILINLLNMGEPWMVTQDSVDAAARIFFPKFYRENKKRVRDRE